MAQNFFNTNNVPSLFALSSSDGTTPVYLWADPVTHGLIFSGSVSIAKDPIPASGLTSAISVQVLDGSGNQITSFGGGTQYTDGGTPPVHPIGPTIEWNDGTNWQTVSAAKPLPVTATFSPAGTQDVNLKQINGTTALTGNGTAGAGAQRVTIASDNTAFSVNATLSAETTKIIGRVGIDQTTPGTTNKVSITDSLGNSMNSAGPGFLKVTDEPYQVFYDSFDSALDTTNYWNSTNGNSGIAASVTAGVMSMGTGTVANGYAKLASIPTFKPSIPGWIVFSDAIQIPDAASPTANAYRYWGTGTTPGTPSVATPVTDGYGFELTTAGVLRAVVYAGGTPTVIATGLTLNTGYVRYIIQVRTDKTYFYINTIDSNGLVATTSFQSPQAQILPKLLLAIGNGTPPGSNSQILCTGAVVSDTGKNAINISDGATPWRRATVKALSNANPLATMIVDASGTQITSFGGGTQYAELVTTTPGTGTLSLGRYKSSAPNLTDGQLYGLQLDVYGNLKVTSSTVVQTTNVQQINGNDIATTADGTQLISLAGPTGDPIDTTGNNLNVAVTSMPSSITTANANAADQVISKVVNASGQTPTATLAYPAQSCAIYTAGIFVNLAFTFQISYDGVNFKTAQSYEVGLTNGTPTSSYGVTSTSTQYRLSLPLSGVKAVRANITSFTSGVCIFTFIFSQLPTNAFDTGFSFWGDAISPPQGNAYLPLGLSGIMLKNAAGTYDRMSTIANVTNNTGTGIAAAGIVAQLDDTSPTTITENQFGNLRMSADRSLLVANRALTSTPTTVASSATTVSLLAANNNRKGATITNESTAVLYVAFGATASVTAYVLTIAGAAAAPFAYYEVPFGYVGQISGIWASAAGNARINEMV